MCALKSRAAIAAEDDGLTLESQFRAIPSRCPCDSLSLGETSIDYATRWLLTVHPPRTQQLAVSQPSYDSGAAAAAAAASAEALVGDKFGHITCVICFNKQISIKKNMGLDSIRQHACSASHTENLWVSAQSSIVQCVQHSLVYSATSVTVLQNITQADIPCVVVITGIPCVVVIENIN